MNGALLINKEQGITSFGIIQALQRELMHAQNCRRRDIPKLGHGGTLDPFATGLLVVLVGRGVKLARYFLGSKKTYSGTIRFGETSQSGDYTDPIIETSSHIPESLEVLQKLADQMTDKPYLQTPPMHSAIKKDGKPLYLLAREGKEIEREPRVCHLYQFQFHEYMPPRGTFTVQCSSGTYIRTLSQDFAKALNTVGMLDSLHRTASGIFNISNALSLNEILEASKKGMKWNELPCWIPFDRLLDGYPRAETTESERQSIFEGKQAVLTQIISRVDSRQWSKNEEDYMTLFCHDSLVAVAKKENGTWHLERVFTPESSNC